MDKLYYFAGNAAAAWLLMMGLLAIIKGYSAPNNPMPDRDLYFVTLVAVAIGLCLLLARFGGR